MKTPLLTFFLLFNLSSQLFALEPPPESPSRWTFIQLSDPQLGMTQYKHDVSSLKAAIRRINDLSPDMVFITGDLLQVIDIASWQEFKTIMQTLRSPYYISPGNHDVISKHHSHQSSKEHMKSITQDHQEDLWKYRKEFGADYFVVKHKQYTFIIVNSVLWRWKHPFMQEESDKQDRWMKERLTEAKDRGSPIIIVSHYPLFQHNRHERNTYYNIPKPKRLELLKLFVDHGVVAYLAGHIHGHQAFSYKGITFLHCESTAMNFDRSPLGFQRWTVSRTGLTHESLRINGSGG